MNVVYTHLLMVQVLLFLLRKNYFFVVQLLQILRKLLGWNQIFYNQALYLVVVQLLQILLKYLGFNQILFYNQTLIPWWYNYFKFYSSS